MSKTFKFDPKLWFENRNLRSCSPEARALWVDILCICHANGGYMHVNNQPMDDNQLARIVGLSIKAVRALLKELGESGIFSVDDRGLYSSKMRKESKGTTKAPRKAATPRTQRATTTKPVESSMVAVTQKVEAMKEGDIFTIAGMDGNGVVGNHNASTLRPAVKSKVLPWYKTPAGWARKAQEQGISMIPGEELEDFKARVADRIPPGAHLEELTPHHRKEIERKVEQYRAKENEK